MTTMTYTGIGDYAKHIANFNDLALKEVISKYFTIEEIPDYATQDGMNDTQVIRTWFVCRNGIRIMEVIHTSQIDLNYGKINIKSSYRWLIDHEKTA